MAVNNLIGFRQGNTYKFQIVYKDSAGLAIDISGYTHWFTLRNDFSDLNPVAQIKSLAGSHVLDDVIGGVATIEIPSDISKNIPVGRYLYDVQRATSDSPPQVFTIVPTLNNIKEKLEVFDRVTKVDS